jgi:D-3-phosphoglycerate dehydrogenase
VIVAEQVAAALEGALVTNAVNIPSIGAEDLEVLGPFIPLAAGLARLAMELANGRAERFELAYHGALSAYDTRLLTVAALNGAFQGRADQPVNYVNAPVIAAERGVEVVEERRRTSRDFTNLIRVTVRSEGHELRVAGTTIGRDDRRWLVSALGYELEMELAPLMAIFRYDDVPGVIGRIGTLFGEAGINIANMAVSRTNRGGKALMAVSLDTPAPPDLVGALHEAGMDDVYVISWARTELRAAPLGSRRWSTRGLSRSNASPRISPRWASRRGSRSFPRERRPLPMPRAPSAASSARSSSRSSSTAAGAGSWR